MVLRRLCYGTHNSWHTQFFHPIPLIPLIHGLNPIFENGWCSMGETVEPPFLSPCGSVSKPCTPGEHQNSWYMDVHPIKNGINRYWSIPMFDSETTRNSPILCRRRFSEVPLSSGPLLHNPCKLAPARVDQCGSRAPKYPKVDPENLWYYGWKKSCTSW